MKNLLPKFLILLILSLSISFVVLSNPSPVYAAATLSLSPATSTVTINDTFPVAIRVNTGGDPVIAVQANLTYDSSKLECVSISNDGSAFGIEAQNFGAGGQVKIARGVTGGQPPVTGDVLVATVTFKAKVSSGSTTVNFTDGCAVIKPAPRGSTDVVNILSGTTGGTYGFKSVGKIGDLNGDGLVNIRDFGIFLGRWGTADPEADFNDDGIVNIRDFGIFLGKWGT